MSTEPADLCLALVLLMAIGGVVWLWWDDRRHARWEDHTDQALAVTRHPSGQTPPEDRPDWPPR